MELEEIKSKNLPVVETYEEFGEKLNEIDFSQEDFAALVTDLTSVLYADSLETVWGFIGFQWDEYNNYGHFNTRSFEVGYIPQIPDPERIQKLPRNFISQMNDKEIIIGYNKFTNLTEIDYIAQDNGKNLTIYTDGITCPLNLYDINTFGDSEKMDFRSIQFIGTKLPTQIICRGRIGRTQQINEKPIYINVDERQEFKLPYQSSKNYWLNNNVRWIGSGDFIISDYMEKGSGISQYINFQSLNNTFIINPSTLY